MSISNIIAQGRTADGASLKLRPTPTNFYPKRINNSNLKTPRPRQNMTLSDFKPTNFKNLSNTTAQQILPSQPDLNSFNRIRQNNSNLYFPK